MCQKRNICSNLYLLIKKEKKLLPAVTSSICYSVLQTKEIDNNDCNVRFLNKEQDYRIELQSRQTLYKNQHTQPLIRRNKNALEFDATNKFKGNENKQNKLQQATGNTPFTKMISFMFR